MFDLLLVPNSSTLYRDPARVARGGCDCTIVSTMIGVAYLSQRRIGLTRMRETLKPSLDLRMVDVHLGPATDLRDGRAPHPRQKPFALNRDRAARLHSADWLRPGA